MGVVTTANGAFGARMRVGIYGTDAAMGGPGALIRDWGEIDIETAGFCMSAVAAEALDPGTQEYWLAFVANSGVAMRRSLNLRMGSPFGVTTPATTVPPIVAATTSRVAWRAFAYAALPNPWGTPSAYQNNMPLIFFRAEP